MVQRVITKQKTKYFGQHSQGILKSEAEHKFGAKLQDMIAKGEVQEAKSARGCDMIYFPREVVGEREETKDSLAMSKKKHTTNDAFDKAAEMIEAMKWTISSTQNQLEAQSITCEHQPMSRHVQMQTTMSTRHPPMQHSPSVHRA